MRRSNAGQRKVHADEAWGDAMEVQVQRQLDIAERELEDSDEESDGDGQDDDSGSPSEGEFSQGTPSRGSQQSREARGKKRPLESTYDEPRKKARQDLPPIKKQLSASAPAAITPIKRSVPAESLSKGDEELARSLLDLSTGDAHEKQVHFFCLFQTSECSR